MSYLDEAYAKVKWNEYQSPQNNILLNPTKIRQVKILVTNKKISKAITWTYPYDNGLLYEVPTYEVIVSGKNSSGIEELKSFEAIRFGVTRKSSDSTSLPYTVGLADKQTHIIKRWLPNYKVHSAPSIEDGAWQVYGNFLVHDGPDDKINEHYASIGCIEICNGPKGFITFNNYIISLSGSVGTSRTEKLSMIGKSKKLIIEYEKASRPPVKQT